MHFRKQRGVGLREKPKQMGRCVCGGLCTTHLRVMCPLLCTNTLASDAPVPVHGE